VSFRVIPVIDVKGGVAVHAIGGRREQYRPLQSRSQATASPIALASRLRDGLGIECLYVADLDAIEGQSGNREFYQRLASLGLAVWIDAGVRDQRDLDAFEGLPAHRFQIVVGLETIKSRAELAAIIERVGRERVVFSLDMDEGRPRTAPGSDWLCEEPLAIASQTIDLGVRHLILLDLALVGTDRGIGTEALMLRIRGQFPFLAVTVGGGIRGIDDVIRLRRLGASSVLVGSAIHDGRIGRRELERIAAGEGSME
jgi:phosphoribosylformimino-5-aminoimidazole carboxamide ribotide isomerase